jgi:hypothetical protein
MAYTTWPATGEGHAEALALRASGEGPVEAAISASSRLGVITVGPRVAASAHVRPPVEPVADVEVVLSVGERTW